MTRFIPLFCYGSNNPTQLRERIGGRKFGKERGYVIGYKRVFRGWSNKWGGGVASIEKCKNKTVFGYIAYLSADELKSLDVYEGVPSIYTKQSIEVHIDSGLLDAITYIKNDHSQFNDPSKDYLDSIVETISCFWTNKNGTPVTINDIKVE